MNVPKIPGFLKPGATAKMTNSQNVNTEATNVLDLMNTLTGVLSNKFAKDIYENKVLKTHDEKSLCKKYFRENSLIFTSVTTKKNLILGDGRIIDTPNQVLKKFMQNTYLESSGWNFAEENAILEAVVTGDGYIERVKTDNTVRYVPIFNSEDIYIDYDFKKSEVKRYIQRVRRKNFLPGVKVESFTLWTPYGVETIFGVDLGKDNIIHYRYGSDTYGVYGRSPIASTISDLRILDVCERSLAVIAKYKAVPKNILSAEDSDVKPLTPAEIQQIIKDIAMAGDYDSVVLSRKIAKTELSYAGKEINLQPTIDYLKRKITVSMAPEFLIHGQETNRATSREQKQMYFLQVASERAPWQEKARKTLSEDINHLANSGIKLGNILTFKYSYGEFNIELPEEKNDRLRQDFTAGLITLREARIEKEMEEIAGTDLFNWELPNQQAAPGLGEQFGEKKNNGEKKGEPTVKRE